MGLKNRIDIGSTYFLTMTFVDWVDVFFEGCIQTRCSGFKNMRNIESNEQLDYQHFSKLLYRMFRRASGTADITPFVTDFLLLKMRNAWLLLMIILPDIFHLQISGILQGLSKNN